MAALSSLFDTVRRRVERLDTTAAAGSALSLALLRILIPPFMLMAPGFRESVRVAGWDRARWAVPEGLGWFVSHVPIRPGLAVAAQVIAAFAALHAILGFRARVALAGLSVCCFYLYAIAQLTGFVWHDMHLLWMAALLSVSPCDHRLGLDARGPVAGEPYALAVWFVRALLATIYFFPGLHKLITSGVAWALGDNLLNQLYWKWQQHGAPPVLRLDRVPGLLAVGGVFTLVFELGFPVLLATRRTRALAAAMGIVFHWLASAVMRISFPSLWICYVVLIDPERMASAFRGWTEKLRLRSPPAPDAPPRALAKTALGPLALVGSAMVGGAVFQGARGQMASYPFACYPTFEWLTPSEMPDLAIELAWADGTRRELIHARDARGYRTQRQWGEIFRLAGVTGPVDRARLRAYWASVLRSSGGAVRLEGITMVRFSRVYRSVRPYDDGNPPVRSELLWEASIARGDSRPANDAALGASASPPSDITP